MATQTINTEINVNLGNAPQTVGELRQEYRDLLKDIGNTTQGTEQYFQKLKQLGAAKADIKDLRDDIKALDPGEKLAAIGNVAQGLVGGFAAATGAIALFAGENEDLQKSLLKVNAALAALQGVQSVIRAFDDGKRIFSALSSSISVTDGVTKGFFATLKANPLGIILTVITAVVGALAIFGDATDDAAESQDRLNQSVEAFTASLDREQSVLESEISLRLSQAKAAKASADTINGIELELSNSRVTRTQKLLDLAKEQEQADQAELSRLILKGASDKKIREQQDNVLGESTRKRLEAEAKYQIEVNKMKEKEVDLNNATNKQINDSFKKGYEERSKLRNQELQQIESTISSVSSLIRDFELQDSTIEDQKAFVEYLKSAGDQVDLTLEKNYAKFYKRLIETGLALKSFEDGQRDSFDKQEADVRLHVKNLNYDFKNLVDSYKDLIKVVKDESGNLSFTPLAPMTSEEFENYKEEIQDIYNVQLLGLKRSQDALDKINSDRTKQRLEKQAEIEKQAADALRTQREEALRKDKEILDITNTENNTVLANQYANGLISLSEYNQAIENEKIQSLERQREINILYGESNVDIEQRLSAARVEIAQREAEAKIKLYDLVGNALGALANLVGENTVAGKALAIASTTISTYLAAQQAYASQFLPIPTPDSPVRGAIAAGIAVVSGLANVKKILSVKVPGKGGSGSGGAGTGGVSGGPTYNAPQVSTGALTTKLSDQTVNQIIAEQNRNQPIRAYVLESDVTDAQGRAFNYRNSSSLGG